MDEQIKKKRPKNCEIRTFSVEKSLFSEFLAVKRKDDKLSHLISKWLKNYVYERYSETEGTTAK